MKKLVSCLLAFLLLFSLPVSAAEFDKDVTARSYCIIDLVTGRTLASHDAETAYEPASLTKIMTALITLENCADPKNTTVTIPSLTLFSDVYAENGVHISMKEGEQFTVEDLLYATMLPSACDAATALAWFIGEGDVQNFYDKMNARAEELGMTATHFENAHGLTADGHASSARDMAILTREALRNEDFAKIASTYTHTIPANNKSSERKLTSTVQLMNPTSPYYFEGASGVKTGFTYGAGRCLITTAARGEEHYLTVVMGSDYALGNRAFPDTIEALNWSFDTFAPQTAVCDASATEIIHGVEKEVLPIFKTDITAPLAADEAFTVTYSLLESVDAPVTAGETVLGTAQVFVGDVLVGETDLVAAVSVEELPYPRWAAVFAWFGIHPYIIMALLFILLLFIAAVLRILYVQSVRRKRRRRRRMAHLKRK